MRIGQRDVVIENYVETPEEVKELAVVERIKRAIERRNSLGMDERIPEE
jgi:hypothetical protein